MVERFKKYKLAFASLWLVCALTLLVNHLVAGARASAWDDGNKLSAATPVKEIEGYKSWTKVNPAPQLMPKRVAASCGIWLSAKGIMADGETNPHRDKYFTVYVNDIGRRAMLNRKHPKFPEGSVIVKEKLTAEDSTTPELLTVMIKQKKGFNPANGDWEYMVLDGAGTKIEGRGNLQNCRACHIATQKTDYIFRTYLPYER